MMNARIEGQWTAEDMPLQPGRNGVPHHTRAGATAAVPTVPAGLPEPLPADQLRWTCDPAVFPFETTRDVQPIAWIIGQGPAANALRFGLETRAGRRPQERGEVTPATRWETTMKSRHARRWTEMNVSGEHGGRGECPAPSYETRNRTPFRSWVLVMILCVAGAPALAQTPSLADLFKRVNATVVEIHTLETDLPESKGRPVRVAGLGSGVLISRDGKVLTAAHLVQTADAIEVEFVTGEKFRGEVASSDPEVDLALLQIDGMPGVPSIASLGDSDRVEVGSSVFVIGAPLGLSHTLTVGHISGRHLLDADGDTTGADLFQTDAAINQGNSGGPMFNLDGEVIGIVSHILSMSGGSEGLGFAVTSNVARRLLDEKSFWTGLDGHILSGDLAQALNIPPPGVGLLVQRIAAGSPADLSGLRGGTMRARIGDEDLVLGGDIVLSVMGIAVDRPGYLAAVSGKLAVARPGQEVEIVVLRGGRVVTLTSTIPSRH